MLRNADVFVKPRHDLRSKSVAGGIITIVAGTTAAILFLAQLYMYAVGSVEHTLHLTESFPIPMLPTTTQDPFQSRVYAIKGKMPLKLHVTFPHIACKDLEIRLNNAPLTGNDFDYKTSGKGGSEKRRPNPIDLKAAGFSDFTGGCTIRTTLRVPIVAGHVTITLNPHAWGQALNHLMIRAQYSEEQKKSDKRVNDYNVTHYIHKIQFGNRYPLAADFPLEDKSHIIENSMGGIALQNVQVRLIPTVYNRMFSSQTTYQLSVVEHTVRPETMSAQSLALMPGLAIAYDVTPLAVHHASGRDNIFIFLSSLVGIVGGVFVTVGLFTGCLVHSAAAVAKKVD